MKNTFNTILLTFCLSFSLPVFSEDGSALYLSKGCIGCHGANGNTPVAPNYPKIGMQNKVYTINQLNDFKNAKRTNGTAALMTGMVAALTEQDMQKLATYLSRKPEQKPLKTAKEKSVAADLYFDKACVACHGANGTKPVMDAYPEIGGQSEIYLLAQMKDIKTGARNNSHSVAMQNIMSNVSDNEMATLAAWLSKQSR